MGEAYGLVVVRKTVTVVFADLVGSTALGERTDPELLRELMAEYHAELRAILERHGGTVEKFVGDAAMAVFGIPQVHEDDALRAVRAAAEIRDAVGKLDLETRIGVNTGEVVAGEGEETLVTGDAVNVAARLEQAAAAGEVLIGKQTLRLLGDAVSVEEVEPLTLKGKSEPVPAWRLVEVRDDVPAFTRPLAAPFVGRAGELATVEDAFALAIATRSCRLATIVGPPGIGKSRLARELLARVDARILVGRCVSYGEGTTYWPLAEIVRQLGDVRGSLAAEPLAAQRIASALGASDEAASPEEIAWGFRRLFEAVARERPLVVVVDDVHWAEPALLDLLEYVAAFASEAPLFLLCTARPDLFDKRPTWAAPSAGSVVVALEPLAADESDELVERLLAERDVSAADRARIVAAAEGKPLFVEQLIAMQAESGDGTLEIPPTLQALLAARIDNLEAEERAVIERGSVEGRLFHRGVVTELLPEPARAGLGGHLLTLVRKEFVRPDRATLPGDDGFRFGHILIRDAAYASIPKRTRAELHARFGDWLAARPDGGGPDEIIGYHLEQAARYRAELGRADADVARRAAAHLAKAGRAALVRTDTGAATNLLERAAALLPADDAERGPLLIDLASAVHESGDLARARTVRAEAEQLAQRDGDARVEWLAKIGQAQIRLFTEAEQTDETRALAERAVAAGAAAGDDLVLAHAWYLVAQTELMRASIGGFDQALHHALGHVRRSGGSTLELPILTGITGGPLVMGPLPVDEAMRRLERVRDEFGTRAGVEMLTLHADAHLQARLGNVDAARDSLDRWRGWLRELGNELSYAQTAVCAWDVLALVGDATEGERHLREAYEFLEPMGETASRSTIAAHLADALHRRGDDEEAERYALVSEEIGSKDDVANESFWRAARARILAARGDLAEAERLAREAIAVSDTTDFMEMRAEAREALATVCAAAGRGDEARRALESALELYEHKGNLVRSAQLRERLARYEPSLP